MKVKESSIDLVLNLANQARKHNVGWSDTFPIDNSIIEFAQKRGFISYRRLRDLIKQKTSLKKLENEFIKLVEPVFKPVDPYTWVVSNDHSFPVLFPESVDLKKKVTFHKEEIAVILAKDEALKEKHDIFKDHLNEFQVETRSIYQWIRQLFIEGTLESEIQIYKVQKDGKKGKTRLSRSLVSNFLEPQKAELVQQDGDVPTLSTSERQVLQFLFWKIENMNDREENLKKLLLEGKKEMPRRDGYLVVFEQQEMLQTNYGVVQTAGYHHKELRHSLKSLAEKNRKLILKTPKEELRISIPLLKKLDIEHKYKEDPEFKKYIVVYIDQHVAELHLKYTSYPKNHFALLRNTPPQTRLNESETAFFDFIYSEISYDHNKGNQIRRKKSDFLSMIDIDDSFAKNKNMAKLAGRVENTFVPKAENLGLIEKFSVEANREEEEVYVFEVAPRNKIYHLF